MTFSPSQEPDVTRIPPLIWRSMTSEVLSEVAIRTKTRWVVSGLITPALGQQGKAARLRIAGGFAVCEAAFLCCASHSVASNSGPFAERLTRPFLQLAAEKLDALRDACPKPGIVWGNFEGSRDLSRASFYLARFASSQGNQCAIRKTKLAISTIAVTPATENTNACVASSIFMAKVRSRNGGGRDPREAPSLKRRLSNAVR